MIRAQEGIIRSFWGGVRGGTFCKKSLPGKTSQQMQMRIGTTSYIYPADIITNVRKLAGRVEDIELLLLEVDDPERDLPDKSVIRELRQIAADHGMTYTVHLPLTLGLAGNRGNVDLARRVILSTLELDPYGFNVHLEDGFWQNSSELPRWVENSLKSLELIREATGALDQICVENLEDQPQGMMDSVLASIPVSCCVDVGHLWKQGIDPLPCLESWLPRTRVVHIHGVGAKDHQKLSVTPLYRLEPVVALLEKSFNGVVTVEIFSEPDLIDSWAVLKELGLAPR
jgi:sugar phosphate isomerase/epimerase